MKWVALLALSILATSACAQSSGGVDVASLRSPFVAGVSYSVKVQTESISATTGKLIANSGQVKDIGIFNPLADSELLAEIPGPKTAGTKTVVASIRATFTVIGALGIDIDPGVVHIKMPNVEVLAGQTLALRYDMPMLGAGKVQWKVAVGAKAVDIPLPAPGPVVVGPITPAPIPDPVPAPTPTPVPIPSPSPTPVPTGASLAGSCITLTGNPFSTVDAPGCAKPLPALSDAAGNVWMFKPDGSDLLIGVASQLPTLQNKFGYWPVVFLYVRNDGAFCAFHQTKGYICFIGGKWQ